MGINMESGLGSLYKIGSDNVPKKMVSPVTISNGLTWSHDNKTFYYIDSPTYKVSAYEYDNDSGEICMSIRSKKMTPTFCEKRKFNITMKFFQQINELCSTSKQTMFLEFRTA